MENHSNSPPNPNSFAGNTFKLLIEATIDYAIFILDAEGIIHTWNMGAEKIFGYSEEDIIGKHFSCLYTQEDINQSLPMQALKLAQENGRTEEINGCRVRKHGEEFKAHIVINCLISETGETSYGNIIQDLTEQIAAEKSLKRMEIILRLFIENTKEYALYLIDPKGFIVTWNQGAERIKGYNSQEIIGQHFSKFFTEEDKAKQHPQEILRLAEKQGWYQEENYRVRKDGNLFWANITLTAIHDEQGKLIGYGKITRDLTERKAIEELLKKQNEELRIAKEAAENANNAKSVFLSAMSHEIRTPLNSMTGMTDLLLDTTLTDDQRQDLEIIRSSEKQLLFVIDNILDFTKVESGPISFESIEFDLSKLMTDLVKLFSVEAEEKGIHIIINIGSEVPSLLKGDLLRIRQILNNLLSNAIKFTQKGQIELNVNVAQALSVNTDSQQEQKISILFEVVDTGIGFSEDVKKKLFQPFAQGDPSISRKYGGSGLGLIISKKLIEGMAGIFDVDSTPGLGSKFWFVIPLVKGVPSKPHEKYKVVTKRFDLSETDKQNFRILLAEDNETNREVALRLIQKFGYHADTAENGLDVLAAIEQNTYDLILMDCQMPEMDGYTATKIIRKLEHEQGKEFIPIVAMTAHALMGDEEACLSIGMNDYITKPIELNRLNQILDGWLSLKLTKHVTTPSLLDINRLEDILGNDRSVIKSFMNSFIVSTQELLLDIKKALNNKDVNTLNANFHRLKGSSGNCGITKMFDLCKQAEKLDDDLQALDNIYQQLSIVFQALKNEVASL